MRPSNPTRRDFLALSAAAATAATSTGIAPITTSAPRGSSSRNKVKMLVLGGTSYLGPAIVHSALALGHEVTLFNRGRTNPKLFPEVAKLNGQRRRPEFGGRGEAQDLKSLKTGQWDVVVDTSGFYPRNVEDMVEVLRDRVERYVFVSSISVYRDLEKNAEPIDEDSVIGTLPDKYVTVMDGDTYGPLKAYCEQAVEAGFPGRASIVRPGYIVGPEDPYDRLTSRVVRLARGGDTLAPGDPGAELQMIDVRDLGAFITKLAGEGIAGRFNATGFEGTITVEEFHHACKLMFAHDTRLTWVADEFLTEHKVTSWEEISCWIPTPVRNHTSIARALAAGLTFRPLADTIRDTHAWATTERPADRPWRGGMTSEREAELLAKWRARK